MDLTVRSNIRVALVALVTIMENAQMILLQEDSNVNVHHVST